MIEKPQNSFEQKVEHIPTPEEVHEVMKQMVKGGEVRETNRILDEQGNLYRLDVLAPGAIEDDAIELFYMRKGTYPTGDSASATEVHSVYVNYPGVGPQASLVNDKWEIVD